MAGFVTHLPLPQPNQLDRFADPGVVVDSLLFDRLKLLLVRLEQRLDGSDRLAELLSGLLEELLARLAQELAADLVELRGEAFLGFPESGKLLFERALALFLRSLERAELAHGHAIRVALSNDLVKLKPE